MCVKVDGEGAWEGNTPSRPTFQALFAPEHGGSYGVWLERPLQPLLLEYATDCRFFHALHAALAQPPGMKKFASAIEAATQ